MKRIIRFIFGLLIFVVVGTLLYCSINLPNQIDYQDQLISYSWFAPTLFALSIILLLISIGFIIFAIKPSHKRRGLYLTFSDGEIYMNKKSIVKNVQHTIEKYGEVRHPNIDVHLFQKKKASYIDINVDLFLAQAENVQTLLKTIREDLKVTTEHFAELPVRNVSINVLDQKALNKRVL